MTRRKRAEAIAKQQPVIACRQAGLSLVEVMMALFILALATSFIIMTARPRDRTADTAMALQNAAESAAMRARLSGQPSGLSIDGRQVTVVTWLDGGWQTVSQRAISLPPSLTVSVNQTAPGFDAPQQQDWPQIVFDPLGHTGEFQLRVRKGSEVHHFTLAPDGRIMPGGPHVQR